MNYVWKCRVKYRVNGILYEIILPDSAENPKDAKAWERIVARHHRVLEKDKLQIVEVIREGYLGLLSGKE